MVCICTSPGLAAKAGRTLGACTFTQQPGPRTLRRYWTSLNLGSSPAAQGASAAIRCAAAGHRAGSVADVEAREPVQAVLAGYVIHHRQPLHTAKMESLPIRLRRLLEVAAVLTPSAAWSLRHAMSEAGQVCAARGDTVTCRSRESRAASARGLAQPARVMRASSDVWPAACGIRVLDVAMLSDRDFNAEQHRWRPQAPHYAGGIPTPIREVSLLNKPAGHDTCASSRTALVSVFRLCGTEDTSRCPPTVMTPNPGPSARSFRMACAMKNGTLVNS